jgi:hypothetical protein
VENCVGTFGALPQSLDGFCGRKYQQFTLRRWASCLTPSITGSLPYAPMPMTSCLQFQGIFPWWTVGVAELLTEFPGGLFLVFANLAAINDDIVLIRTAVNLNGAEREFVETHIRLLGRWLHALFLDGRA